MWCDKVIAKMERVQLFASQCRMVWLYDTIRYDTIKVKVKKGKGAYSSS